MKPGPVVWFEKATLLLGLKASPLAVAPSVKASALREAADEWQIGAWADDLPTGGSRPQLILGMAQRATDWLRARADRMEQL